MWQLYSRVPRRRWDITPKLISRNRLYLWIDRLPTSLPKDRWYSWWIDCDNKNSAVKSVPIAEGAGLTEIITFMPLTTPEKAVEFIRPSNLTELMWPRLDRSASVKIWFQGSRYRCLNVARKNKTWPLWLKRNKYNPKEEIKWDQHGLCSDTGLVAEKISNSSSSSDLC